MNSAFEAIKNNSIVNSNSVNNEYDNANKMLGFVELEAEVKLLKE